MPKNEDNTWYYRNTAVPKCPHCDDDLEDWWDGHVGARHEVEEVVTCPHCCKNFTCTACCSPTFSTDFKD